MKRAQKAYKNLDFLTSRSARSLRILAEYQEPEKRFLEKNIKHTVVFFGSARIEPDKKKSPLTHKFYKAAEQFAYLLAKWSHELAKNGDGFTICSGGGPGIMEAANRGAQRAHSLSIGLNISIPYEQEANHYISSGYNFEFHYFFMRKLWFAYLARAMVVFPGGFGTMDELFELLTLRQTRKITKPLPTVVFGRKFWNEIVDFDALVKWGTISKSDLKLFRFCDTVDEAYDYLVRQLRGR